MPDLRTTWLGLELEHPIIAAASPLSKTVDQVRQLADGGASAVVLYSLFEEQIDHQSHELDHYLHRGTESFAEALDYFPDLGHYNVGVDGYLEHIARCKRAVQVPIIASLNGVSRGGWLQYARQIEEAGADAIELNIYYLPTDLDLTGTELESSYVDLVAEVRSRVALPIALKLAPYFTSLPNLASRIVDAGAGGLVLFNRFYQPDLDLESFQVVPTVTLSRSDELRLPLRWIAILSARLQCDFAATSGVSDGLDVAKSMLAGANVVQVASELLRGGAERAGCIVDELSEWMEQAQYASVAEMRGSMNQRSVAQPAAFERANYMKALSSLDDSVP